MRKHPSDFSQQLVREKALYLYISAFERGDADKMEAILQQAMYDPQLEEMIMEAHEYYLADEEVKLREEDFARILDLVVRYLPSGIPEEEEAIAIPPLTIGDVFSKLQEDKRLQGAMKQEVQQVNAKLAQTNVPLPENLAMKSVYRLFEQLGVAVSAKLQKLFRDQAIFLSMTRQQGIAQLAATRRQRTQRLRKSQREEEKES
ncbi:MAG TPA: hypothetical protein VKY19_08560 [Ktedonosporobacter sp.]|jgi:hypothetical protein|nr:hypothetical protein [Ktedonosporobacter sp.]